MTTPLDAQTVRSELVDALRLDLVGPDNAHACACELLRESPTRWYLTGSLVPRNAPEDQRADPDAVDEVYSGDDAPGDDGAPPDRAAADQSYLPSSMGLSVLVPTCVVTLDVRVCWGDYESEVVPAVGGYAGDGDSGGAGEGRWRMKAPMPPTMPRPIAGRSWRIATHRASAGAIGERRVRRGLRCRCRRWTARRSASLLQRAAG